MMHSDKIATIDGLSGVGKGSVAKAVASTLNWDLLDSGVIYRALAFLVEQNNTPLDDLDTIIDLAHHLKLHFDATADTELLPVYLNDNEISQQLRTERYGEQASHLAKMLEVREAILDRQRAFATDKGLVADGRDMGTKVFPQARIKVFLIASSMERAKRRLLQLQKFNATGKITPSLDKDELARVARDIESRDKRDKERKHSPLKPADDAHIIDTTRMSLAQVIAQVLALVNQSQGA